MRFNSHAFAGTALGLLMAASPASATNLGAATDRAMAYAPIILAQADVENPDQKPKKKERRAERRAEKKSETGAADEGAPRSREAERPKHQRQKAAEERRSNDSAGKASANEEAPAMKPDRGRKRRSDEAGRQAAQGGDNGEPAAKRKARDEKEAKRPAAGREATENAEATKADRGEPDEGKKHRRTDKNAKRGEDSGKAAEEKTPRPKATEDRSEPKAEEKAKREEKRGKNAKGEEAGNAKSGETKAGNDENSPPTPEAKPEQAEENAGNGGKAEKQSERAERKKERGEKGQNAENDQNAKNGKNAENGQNTENAENGRKNENRKNAKGENRRNAEGKETGANEQAAEGGQGAKGGGNVVLPKSLNGQRAGEGRKRERRKAGEENGNAENNALPDSARGRHGQRKEAGRGGKAEPLPDSDAAAQADIERTTKIESITAVKGKRVDKPERVYREAPDNVKVVKKIDNRTIVEVNNEVFVRGSDRPRITHHARDVYYEDLPHRRTRETVIRPNGVRVVTIRNEYGDVIRRSKFTRDDREIVLVYVPDRYLGNDNGWVNVGADLPPLVVDVPRDEYVLEADQIDDPDRYYTFLEQPPIEPVRRIYTIGEVKRSARIRDIMPRIDLDTITFDFGSAEIGQDQADELQGLADAIKRILDDNPAETFLIEGHTDAVGSDQANLVLSDQRADSVASALTQMFEIPPENLSTQGYGEEFLKVDTQEANRQNRRVTVRRITPLVAPVASAQ